VQGSAEINRQEAGRHLHQAFRRNTRAGGDDLVAADVDAKNILASELQLGSQNNLTTLDDEAFLDIVDRQACAAAG
jgi:hypothetical protein